VDSKTDGSASILVLYATPTRPGFCQHIGTQILISPKKKDGKKPPGVGIFSKLPVSLLHIAAPFFLAQDAVFLHTQERAMYSRSRYAFGNFDPSFNITSDYKAYASSLLMPNDQDKAVISLRRWISEKAGGGPIWGKSAQLLGLPTVDAKRAMSTWDQHTKQCTLCQKNLQKIKSFRNWSIALAAVSSIMIRRRVVALLITAIFGGLAAALNKFKGLYYETSYNHQDNN